MVGQIDMILRRVGMAGVTFCKVAGIASATWSRVGRGTEQLTSEEFLRLTCLANEIDSLAGEAEPFRLPLKDPKAIQRLLVLRRQGVTWHTAVTIQDVERELVEQ